MTIYLIEVTIRELFEGYVDLGIDGVYGYAGRLDIRPPYQREFVYDQEKKEAVIRSILSGYPINVMYWAKRDDGNFEVLDGQQRTISICQYLAEDFSVNGIFFRTYKDRMDDFLNYKLMVYVCEGTPTDKLAWFETINIAGLELTKQELRNAIYHGPWLADAKRYFSKPSCAGYNLGKRYIKGDYTRQTYLETAIDWITLIEYDVSLPAEKRIRNYMGSKQYTDSASDLWAHFQNTISWIETTFTHYNDLMKGLPWGYLYASYKDKEFDSVFLNERVNQLMIDEEITNQRGIYQYLLSGNERHLNLRTFTQSQKRTQYANQNGVCNHCKETFTLEQMEADHIIPWSKDGKTEMSNIQLLCIPCNRHKSNN